MLNRLQINNYRCLRDVDVPLKALTIIIGPNNSGKSAFLSAVDLLGKAPSETNRNQPVNIADHWRFQRSSSPIITASSTEKGEVLVKRQGDFWLRTGDNSEIAPISFFDSIQVPAMESQGATERSGIPPIDNKASNLPGYLDALLRKDRDRFFRVLETLKQLIPGLVNINIETPSADKRRIDLVFENKLGMDAQYASYGVKLMIFFVSLANHPNPPKTILLEEPETGVHPRRLQNIVHLLVGLSEGAYSERKAQVLVTTHSPYLLDYIDPKVHQVLVFQRGEDGACVAAPVDTERLTLFLSEFMLGEVWLNQEEAGLVEKVR